MASLLQKQLPELLAGEVSNPITLSFADRTAEQAYRADRFIKSLAQIRLALVLGGLLYAAFGALDEQLLPEAKLSAWIIRYAVVCPLITGLLLFSYSRHFQDLMEFSVGFVGFMSGCGLLAILALATPPNNYLYYAGLPLIAMFYFTLLRLRFLTATTLAWTLFVFYEVIAIWIHHAPTAILINNTFFLVAFNITGMLANYSLESYMRLDFLQRRIIQQQTEHLSETLLEVDQRRREAEDISHLDPLTNLFNRRYFFSLIEYECNKDRHFLRDSSIMLLDLDHFKLVNDTYGHLVGDQVLQGIAKIIKHSIRDRDVPCRYGGEEFAILLPEASIETAIRVGQRLRETLDSSPFYTDRGLVHITTSIGVACLSKNDEADFDTLIERSDRALYAAKEAGRNQVRALRGDDDPILSEAPTDR